MPAHCPSLSVFISGLLDSVRCGCAGHVLLMHVERAPSYSDACSSLRTDFCTLQPQWRRVHQNNVACVYALHSGYPTERQYA